MNISEVQRGDAEDILVFCKRLKEERAEMTFADVEGLDEVLEWIDNPLEHLFVLREANRIVAFLKARQGEGELSHSAFLSAAVLREKRGEGLVNQLSTWSLERLKSRGVKIVRAYVYSNNHASISAVLKDGFHCSGTVQMHHFNSETGMWIDDIIFHKYL